MPPSPQLQKWKKNKIFEAIQGVGLDPREFEFKESDAEVRLKHKWSTSYFIFGGDAGDYVGRYVVGDDPEWPYQVYSWEALITRVSDWLGAVKRDLDTPDLWAQLKGEAELLGGASIGANENSPFTPEEQKHIERRLQELKARVTRTYSLSEPEMEILNAKIDYVVDAATRLGRIDWRNAVVGAILGYIITAGLPPESARSIFQILSALLKGLSHYFGHSLPELPSL
jgi:hypothetical protein